MTRTALIGILVFLVVETAHTQDVSVVGCATIVSGNDTTYTFYLNDHLGVQFINRLSAEYGQPSSKSYARHYWKKIDIPGIGNRSIEVTEGAVMTDDNGNAKFSPFLSDIDRSSKLSANPAVYSRLEIVLKQGNENAAKSAQAKAAMIAFIESYLYN
ncbi:MAG: hypothetical protein Kow0075_15360 [Salibacteraceae bacterium]